jgi:hypothetical protein
MLQEPTDTIIQREEKGRSGWRRWAQPERQSPAKQKNNTNRDWAKIQRGLGRTWPARRRPSL